MDYRGLIAIILASCMGLGWVIILSAMSYWHTPVSEKGAAALEAIGIGMISIISFYVGRNTNGKV